MQKTTTHDSLLLHFTIIKDLSIYVTIKREIKKDLYKTGKGGGDPSIGVGDAYWIQRGKSFGYCLLRLQLHTPTMMLSTMYVQT